MRKLLLKGFTNKRANPQPAGYQDSVLELWGSAHRQEGWEGGPLSTKEENMELIWYLRLEESERYNKKVGMGGGGMGEHICLALPLPSLN